MSIRMATEQDLPAILQIYAPYIKNTAITFEYEVPSLESFTQRFWNITAQFAWLVWEEDGQVAGYAYGSLPFARAAYQWCAEISVYLRPDIQGKGVGRALYTALEHILREQGYMKVYTIITTANQGSVDFHRALGYRHTASMPGCGFKFGSWYGTTWMEKQLNFVETPSNPPVPIGSIVNIDRFFQ